MTTDSTLPKKINLTALNSIVNRLDLEPADKTALRLKISTCPVPPNKNKFKYNKRLNYLVLILDLLPVDIAAALHVHRSHISLWRYYTHPMSEKHYTKLLLSLPALLESRIKENQKKVDRDKKMLAFFSETHANHQPQ